MAQPALINTNLTKKVEEVIAAYEKGCFDPEIMRICGWTQQEFDENYATSSHWAKIIDMGRSMCRAYWYKLGRENVGNKDLNTPLYIAFMKNCFGWAGTNEQGAANLPIKAQSQDQMRSDITKMLKALAKTNPELIGGLLKDIKAD